MKFQRSEVIVTVMMFLFLCGCVSPTKMEQKIQQKEPYGTLSSTKAPKELANCIVSKVQSELVEKTTGYHFRVEEDFNVALQKKPDQTYHVTITLTNIRNPLMVGDVQIKPSVNGSMVEYRTFGLWVWKGRLWRIVEGCALGATVPIAGLNEDLYKASGRGDLPEVKRLLAKGADVNGKIEVGGELGIPKGATTTALIAASSDGHREVVEALLAGGADVNGKGIMGYTALMAASTFNHPEIVRLLLDKGADVNAMTKTNRTALGENNSASGGPPNPEIREMLIKAGADPGTEQAWRKYHLPPPEKLPGVR